MAPKTEDQTTIDDEAVVDEPKRQDPDSDVTEMNFDGSDDDKMLLTDEERAALADEDDEGEGEGDEDAAQASDDENAGDDGEGEKDEPQPDTHHAAPPKEPYEIPENVLVGDKLDARLTEIYEARAKLLDDFEDGELTKDDYLTQLDEMEKEARSLATEASKHQALYEDHQKSIEEAWKREAKTYLDTHAGLKEETVLRAYDSIVRSMNSNPLFAAMRNDTFLAAAHDTLYAQREHLGLEVPPRIAPKPEPKPEALKAKPKEERPGAPRTLRTVPQSDPASAGDNRFAPVDATLESGDPQKIEKAMNSMSPEQMEEWLRSA